MPKKFDPECPFCLAARDNSAPPDNQRIGKMQRAVLFLDDRQQVILAAHTHIASADDMHARERELFEQDIAQATEAINAVSGGPAQPQAIDAAHLQIHFTPALSGTASDLIGDVREALGFIRQPVTDPLLKNWVNEQGQVFDWPNLKHPDEQAAVRAYLAAKFEPGRAYTEKEVNNRLNEWATFGDWALLRRELFMHGFIKRYKDGSKYWLGDVEPDAGA